MRPINLVAVFAIAMLLFVLTVAFALDMPPTLTPPVNAEPATGFQPPASPPQPPAPTARFDEYQVAPETPQKIAKSIQPPEPLDVASCPVPPDTLPNPSVKSDLSAEVAKIKLMELENAWNKLINEIPPTQSKEIENLKPIAKDFHDKSVMYYKAGNYRLSLVYSHLSLEIIHAIEEFRR